MNAPSPAPELIPGWTAIDDVQRLSPFLVTLASDDDHWLFATSNGGLTMGRGSPEVALLPYRTQDKLADLAHVTGSLTLVRARRPGEAEVLWQPLDPTAQDPTAHGRRRRMEKKLDGTQLSWSEQNEALGLRFTESWGLGRRLGFLRRCTLENRGDTAVQIELLDGLQDLAAWGVDDDFQARMGMLVDAYKRVECLPGTRLRLVYLSSVPTDRAEPSECLRCNVAWSLGLPSPVSLVTSRQVEAFRAGHMPRPESEARGQRAACLDVARLELPPGGRHSWYTVGDVALSTAAATRLQQLLEDHDPARLAAMVEAELVETSRGVQARIATADGLQCTADAPRCHRHASNALFNIMRGGLPLDGHRVPRDAWRAHLARFDRRVAERHDAWAATLPERLDQQDLAHAVAQRGDPALERLTRELLPLTFSRRHGDPSRPWNRFSIQVRDARGEPRLAWQGNWRDIFQNWEALLHSFPGWLEGAVSLFLSASTADGYNPYRMTSQGFEWETVSPDEPWANIGYWGDHQVAYLLRLLEAAQRFQPGRLDALLDAPAFAYARVPYRIASYAELRVHPRRSITYDHDAERQIASRVEQVGEAGKLLWSADGEVLQVGLLEKLLVTLLARLASFVPGGGIWMNTQRPEWNDANNALVGYGVSVVTMAWCHRALAFLEGWWGSLPADRAVSVSAEVADWLRSQAPVLADARACRPDDPSARGFVMEALGQGVSRYREGLYARGLSGERASLTLGEVQAWLVDSRRALAESLRANRRSDYLFHAYNLLRFEPDGGVGLERLPVMLEGQAAVLSAGLLGPEEALRLAQALRQSALYRADQDSYMLYPDRDLPRFLDKNRLDPRVVRGSALLRALASDPDQPIVERDAHGDLRFGGDLRNGEQLRAALAGLPPAYRDLVAAEGEAVVAHMEALFEHHAFTGRSGTFFAYEGLGSIYWHMVSKLVLALQEQALDAEEAGAAEAPRLARAYAAAQHGLGIHKAPERYGAFPSDAYSHTPRHAGAQQPGMTGQVKEDLLVRWGELGVRVEAGGLSFRPVLLRRAELLDQETRWAFLDVQGRVQALTVPRDGLAFTFCQVPVVYRLGAEPRLVLSLDDGAAVESEGTALPAELAQAVLARTGRVRRIEVLLPEAWLRGDPR